MRRGTLSALENPAIPDRPRASDGSWYDVDELVQLTWTKTRFRCRQCLGVRYSSQAETRAARATRGMFKIVKRLYPKAEFDELLPKPKGMHWKTYWRLADKYEAYDEQWGIETIRRFGLRLDF